MNKYFFSKMSGAGNDFIVIDKSLNPNLSLSKQAVNKLCNRRTGIGADGFIIISDNSEKDFEMEYFNADGAPGSLCGNGARCAIRFAELSNRINNGKTKFVCGGSNFSGEIISEDLVKFYLNSPKKIKLNFKIKAFNQLINASFADTGSPHVVIKIEDVLSDPKKHGSFYTDIEKFPVNELGKEIRQHKDFAPGGTNVNFIQLKENKIYIRTFERGVEDETLACGTGSVAAAIIAFLNYDSKTPIELITRSQEILNVNFKYENDKFENISLTGPAKVTFNGEFLLNKFL